MKPTIIVASAIVLIAWLVFGSICCLNADLSNGAPKTKRGVLIAFIALGPLGFILIGIVMIFNITAEFFKRVIQSIANKIK